MGSDMNIHVLEGITEKSIEILHSTSLGSKYFAGFYKKFSQKQWNQACEDISNTPSIWIGSHSHFNDDDGNPQCITKLHDLISEDLPVLNDRLIAKIIKAMELPNKTSYSVNTIDEVKTFLEKYKGSKIFVVCW
jgi:hypothetical protein